MNHQVFIALPEELSSSCFEGLSMGAIGLLAFLVGRKRVPITAEDIESKAQEFERPLVNSYLWELHDKKLIASFELNDLYWKKEGATDEG